MNVIIRTDASTIIGTGHVMRCLSLADALSRNGATLQFICRLNDVHLGELINERGYSVNVLRTPTTNGKTATKAGYSEWLGASWQVDAKETIALINTLDCKPDWLIVDHYALDIRWEEYLRTAVGRILVIDDLADRKHNCDVLLDQNYFEDSETRYVGKVPESCQLLFGPRYALLRDEFRPLRFGRKARSGAVRKILVFFGGIDSADYTSVAIDALVGMDLRECHVDVVIGAHHRNRRAIEAACNEHNFQCHVQTTQMAELMIDADLAIGAGGSVTWERCCMGLPCLTFSLADNQQQLVRAAALAGLLYAPEVRPDDCDGVTRHLQALIENPLIREAVSRSAMEMVDGLGADRVLQAMGVLSLSVREALSTDSESIFEWRNDPTVRKMSRNVASLDWASHRAWFDSILSDSNRPLLIGESAGEPLGVVRFDIDKDTAELSIYMVPGKNQRGLGAKLLLAAEQWLTNTRPDVRLLQAEVLGENLPSHRLFNGAGYLVDTTKYTKRLQ